MSPRPPQYSAGDPDPYEVQKRNLGEVLSENRHLGDPGDDYERRAAEARFKAEFIAQGTTLAAVRGRNRAAQRAARLAARTSTQG